MDQQSEELVKTLRARIDAALKEINENIDGGDEARNQDHTLCMIAAALEGDPNYYASLKTRRIR